MIFFGISKSKKRVHKPLGMSSCPNCQEEGYLRAFAYPQYFHLYWIPMFPLGKGVRAECMNCEMEFKGKKMPKAASVYADELKKSVKTPFSHFTGLGILTVLVLFIISIWNSTDKETTKYLQDPQVNDIYLMDLTEGYSYWKLIEIENDTLSFHTSNLYTESIFDIDKLAKTGIYTGDTIKYNYPEVKGMLEGDDLYKINRD